MSNSTLTVNELVAKYKNYTLQDQLDILKSRRLEILEQNPVNSPNYFNAGKELAVLNDKTKTLNIVAEKVCWQKAVKAIFGDDGYSACKVWMQIEIQKSGFIA